MTIKALYPNIAPSLSLDFANVKALDPRITFARASTATYYNGVTTAKAEENLLVQSQAFNTASWSLTGMTVASGVTAPDATSTAFTLNEGTAASSVHSLHQAPSLSASTTYTFSCFIKNVDAGFAGLAINTTSASNYGTVEFDLSGSGSVNRTAVLGTGFSIVASSITAVGNSWFRCVATITLGSASVSDARATVYMSDGSGSFDNRGRPTYTGTSKTIEAWGAQLEQRSAVTAYTPTTTQPITNYVPVLLSAADNVARFDHNPVTGESLGLLIEEQRTNLLLRSEEFENASWGKTRASITANTVVAPDGTLTGDKLVEDTTASDTHLVNQSSLALTAVPFTWSVYLKAGERTWARLTLLDGVATHSTFFNLSTGALGAVSSGVTATITSVGNGWYRCSITVTPAVTANGIARVTLATNDSAITYTGNGFNGIYIWGAQLEAGAFPTSYIPTVASQVTRSADAASMTGANFSSWYRQDEGSFYSEHSAVASINQRVYAASDNTTNNTFEAVHTGGTGVGVNFFVRTNAVNQTTVPANATPASGQSYKLAGAYRFNDVAASRDGGAVGTASTVLLPVVDRFFIGRGGSGGNPLNGTICKLAYYPKRLANAELQALTQN